MIELVRARGLLIWQMVGNNRVRMYQKENQQLLKTLQRLAMRRASKQQGELSGNKEVLNEGKM